MSSFFYLVAWVDQKEYPNKRLIHITWLLIRLQTLKTTTTLPPLLKPPSPPHIQKNTFHVTLSRRYQGLAKTTDSSSIAACGSDTVFQPSDYWEVTRHPNTNTHTHARERKYKNLTRSAKNSRSKTPQNKHQPPKETTETKIGRDSFMYVYKRNTSTKE